MRLTIIFSLLTVFLLNSEASAQRLDTARLERIETVLQAEVDDGVRAGFVAAVMMGDKVAYSTAVGAADRENGTPMSLETRFRIASMTKPITTVAALILAEEGALLLDDPVSRYIPAFESLVVATDHAALPSGEFATEPLKRPMTIRHLMTHTAGLGYVFDQETDLGKRNLELAIAAEGDLAARIDNLANAPLYDQPGEIWRYSFATDVLGRVVEVASGMSLEAFMKERIFDPLGMSSTEFFLDETDFENLATVYVFDESGMLQRAAAGGLSGDPNAAGMGWASGGGGLVSSVGDYSRFMMMLINDGALGRARVLSPASVRLLYSDQLLPSARPADWKARGMTFGLGGWVLEKPGYFGSMAAPGQFGWGGYYDTYFTISPEDNLGVIVMSQREPGPHDRQSRAHNLVKAIAFGAME